MICGLDTLLDGSSQPGAAELRASLGALVARAGSDHRFLGDKVLDGLGWVRRAHFEVDGEALSFVVKRSSPARAQRNILAADRWLPAVGLEGAVPRILATATEPGGRYVWHVYEDAGEHTLETDRDANALAAATSFVAALHVRFVGHPLLADAPELDDLGTRFYSNSVSETITNLEAIPRARLDGDEIALVERLLERMWTLHEQAPHRMEAIAELGGPQTLLHGDLWLENVLLAVEGDAVRIRVIDWDHAGLGPIGYDLSTFLAQLPAEEREGVLDRYEELAGDVWPLPSRGELNYVFETFELARITSCLPWPALAAAREPRASWPIEDLARVEDWFSTIDVVLEPR